MLNLYDNNCVRLNGRLGKKPMTIDEKGHFVGSSLATLDKFLDVEGDFIKGTNWHNVIFVDEAAQHALDNLDKGDAIIITGMLKTRQTVNKKTGTTIYTTSVYVYRSKDIQINMLKNTEVAVANEPAVVAN